jgi:hypothetical protein
MFVVQEEAEISFFAWLSFFIFKMSEFDIVFEDTEEKIVAPTMSGEKAAERDYDSDDDTGIVDARPATAISSSDIGEGRIDESDDGFEIIKIGLDIGGVLSDEGDKAPILIDVPNALESLHRLYNYHTAENDGENKKRKFKLYIISYSSEKRSTTRYNKIVSNELAHLFVEQYFVSDRNYKKYVLQYLGCHIMIDDKESILDDIQKFDSSIVTILFQQYNKQKKTAHRRHLIADSWSDVMNHVEPIVLPTRTKKQLEKAREVVNIQDMFEVQSLGPHGWFF